MIKNPWLRETLPGALLLIGSGAVVVGVGALAGIWWGVIAGGILTGFIGYLGIED